ncbi:hypothetical protein [Sinorhizobium meliloti]|uniref:hypothetical protein n=1 Tax=Rhizobium meliloti TaxID=382 RepID=UPI000FDBE830|nr:hypothetical protein [Sinorhizobium meliloti]MDW9766673.1 hypothetical protein [Sinorhizobium meliloti]MDW9989260.1 hypothetical protein [Sinorhizobium meliloti]MDX0243557.1 hypothetical protein [Sinorhizobium meliloti]MDX0399606.1 hypothetical protein [Sinorhizobium meliloti]RVP10705.1 hypothetical protein CN083_03925 [Sinorhizobium meliloti]
MRHFSLMAAMSGFLLTAAAEASATDYLFHVSCADKNVVVQWKTGDVDPGREYLRVVTGTHNPDCSITDYNEATDAGLEREVYSHEAGIVRGIPFIGGIICWVFGCN